ncbi:MAG: hypothetical protein ACXQT4_04400 [Methanotrichaceae archaeon]
MLEREIQDLSHKIISPETPLFMAEKLTIEAIILEFVSLGTERALDEKTGLSLHTLEKRFS